MPGATWCSLLLACPRSPRRWEHCRPGARPHGGAGAQSRAQQSCLGLTRSLWLPQAPLCKASSDSYSPLKTLAQVHSSASYSGLAVCRVLLSPAPALSQGNSGFPLQAPPTLTSHIALRQIPPRSPKAEAHGRPGMCRGGVEAAPVSSPQAPASGNYSPGRHRPRLLNALA